MDKVAYENSVKLQKEAEKARLKELAEKAKKRNEEIYNSVPEQYRNFTNVFNVSTLNLIGAFLCEKQDEINQLDYIDDPVLKVCEKFLDWHVEVGSRILFKKLSSPFDRDIHKQIISQAWEQVKKEQEIIYNARTAYKKNMHKLREENPNYPAENMSRWIALCDGFNQFEALREFGYPLPFKVATAE
jgi:Fe-S cluster biosynthesis and repair protein YggX